MRSLRSTLTIRLVVFLAGLFVLLGIAGGFSVRYLVEDYVATQLEHTMQALLAGLEYDSSGAPRLGTTRIPPMFEQPFSGHYYVIATNGTRIRSRSLWDEELAEDTVVPTGSVNRTWSRGPRNQELLLVTAGYHKQAHDVVLTVATDFSQISAGIQRLQWSFAGVSLLMLFIAIWLQQRWILSGLEPLKRLRSEVRGLQRGERREVNTDVPEEVAPLAQEINRLSELTAQRLQRSRNALGNVAHALKTPLTILTRLADHPHLRDKPELSADLRQQTGLISERIEAELKRARIAGNPTPGERVQLAAEVRDLVDTLAKIYREKAIRVNRDIEEHVVFPGDRSDLLELMGNLLDNAYKWARERIDVHAKPINGELLLVVEDDGPGLAEDIQARALQRGSRIDETRHGHGLGLAIVNDIVNQYGARIAFRQSDSLGGLLVEINLPRH